VSVRVIAIFAWPGGTEETIGCAGCDAQPAHKIAMSEKIAPIPTALRADAMGVERARQMSFSNL
jgi:hypothetical protein